MRLLTQILFFTLVPLIIVLGSNFYQSLDMKDVMEQQINNEIKGIKKDIEKNLEKKIVIAKQISSLFSSNSEVIQGLDQRDNDLLFNISKHFISNDLISNTLFIDKNALIVCRGTDELKFNDSIKNDPIYEIFKKKEPFYGLLKFDGFYQYAAMTPVYKYDIIFIGYVITSHIINDTFLKQLNEQNTFLQFNSNKNIIDNFNQLFKDNRNKYSYIKFKTKIPSLNNIETSFTLYTDFNHKKALISKYQKEQTLFIIFMLVIFTLFVVIFVRRTLYPLNLFNQNLIDFTNKHQSIDELIDKLEKAKHSKNELKQLEDSVLMALKKLKQTQNELIVSQEEAKRANRIKNEFLSNMSHEIRTPMNAVIGFSNVLLKKAYDPNEISYLETIKTSAVSLTTIIDDILELSKIEAGTLVIEKDYTYMIDVFKELQLEMDKNMSLEDLDFIIDIDKVSKKFNFNIDRNRLKQVLRIIINSSIRLTKKGFIKLSLIIERTNNNEANIKISIKQGGTNIDRSKQKIVFDTLTQVYEDDDISKIYSGTGLGLTISKKLIALMDGYVEIENGKDMETTFNINFKKVSYIQH